MDNGEFYPVYSAYISDNKVNVYVALCTPLTLKTKDMTKYGDTGKAAMPLGLSAWGGQL
jgi:hypothetical protein